MINDKYYCINFKSQDQLNKLVDSFKLQGFAYGTTTDDINEIKYLGMRYFGENNCYLSVDASKKHYHKTYVSCGKGYRDVVYDYEDYMKLFRQSVNSIIN